MQNTSFLKFASGRTGILLLFLTLIVFLTDRCENYDYVPPEFFVLNTNVVLGQPINGFSFKEFKIISYTNTSTKPDFLVLAHTNEAGDVIGPMLTHPDLEDIFILIKGYNDLTSAKNHFDTLSTVISRQFQPVAMDVKPFEIWQIKDNTGAMGLILLLETKIDNINNTPYAEVKFKAKKIN